MRIRKELLWPLLLTAGVVIADQISKGLIVRYVEPYYKQGFTIDVIGEVVRILHTSNTAIAFSIGRNLSMPLKRILFTILPLLLLGGMFAYYFLAPGTRLQRWSLASLLGGGIGNLIDRVFRVGGVVDFIDVKFYGFLGYERWPTFNVADSSIVVGAILLLVATFIDSRRIHREEMAAKAEKPSKSAASSSAGGKK